MNATEAHVMAIAFAKAAETAHHTDTNERREPI
jgi:hypothetical protein